MADFLDNNSTLAANSGVVIERVGGESQLTAGRVIVYKNRSGQERGDPRIIPPLRNQPEPDLLHDFAHTQGLANPGSIQPQVRPGVYLEVGTPR